MGLRARTRKGDIPLGGAGSLMGRALSSGLPVASSCSGRGACARCLVQILEGASAVMPPEAHEGEVLARNGVRDGGRLACQTHLADTEAEVLITTGYW